MQQQTPAACYNTAGQFVQQIFAKAKVDQASPFQDRHAGSVPKTSLPNQSVRVSACQYTAAQGPRKQLKTSGALPALRACKRPWLSLHLGAMSSPPKISPALDISRLL